MYQQPMPEWKRKMFADARACRAKIKALRERGAEPREERIVFHPSGSIYEKGRYGCPLCDSDCWYDHNPHGEWNDACSNPECEYYRLDYIID